MIYFRVISVARREVRDKWDVEFLNESTLLRYKEAKYYVFDRTRSVGGEDDSITNVNLAMLVCFSFMEFYHLTSRVWLIHLNISLN